MKNLVFFQINEFDYHFLIKNAHKYNCLNISNFFNLNKIQTISDDLVEGEDLDPWVQWVSINTGLDSKTHKIFSFGKSLDEKHLQTWDRLSKFNLNSSIWGSMNSFLNSKKNIDNFMPDPWNFSQDCYPKKYNFFLALPRYFAQNYGSIKYFNLIIGALKFIYSLFRLNLILDVLRELPFFIKSIFLSKKKILMFVLFIDLINLILINKSLKKKKSEYLVVFLNSIAHYQHNYWDKKDTEFLFFKWVDKFCEKMLIIKSNYNNYIIANGLSQKKIDPHYIVKIKNPEKFFSELGIEFKHIEPNMTAGGTIIFENSKNKNKAFEILNNFKLKNKNLFYLKNFEFENKIYFRLELILKKPVYKIDIKKENPLENFEIDFSNNNEIEVINKILKNLLLIKSTSVHSNTGVLLYKNINIKHNQNLIKNHEINDIILEFFLGEK